MTLRDDGYVALALAEVSSRVTSFKCKPNVSMVIGLAQWRGLTTLHLSGWRSPAAIAPDFACQTFCGCVKKKLKSFFASFSFGWSRSHSCGAASEFCANRCRTPHVGNSQSDLASIFENGESSSSLVGFSGVCASYFLVLLQHDPVKAKIFEPLARIARLSLHSPQFKARNLSAILMHNASIRRLSFSLEDEDDDDDDDDEVCGKCCFSFISAVLKDRQRTSPKDMKRLLHALASCTSLERCKVGATFHLAHLKQLYKAFAALPLLVHLDLSPSYYSFQDEDEADPGAFSKFFALPQVKTLHLFSTFLEMATPDLALKELCNNKALEELCLEEDIENDVADTWTVSLWSCNSKLTHIGTPMILASPLLARNKLLRRNCKKACLTLIAVRLFCRSEVKENPSEKKHFCNFEKGGNGFRSKRSDSPRCRVSLEHSNRFVLADSVRKSAV